MLTIILKLTFFGILVTFPYTNAAQLDCKDIDPAACKTKFLDALENGARLKYLELAHSILKKDIKIFTAVANELPPNDPHIKILNNLINSLNADMKKVENVNFMTDDMRTGNLMCYILDDVYPDFNRPDKESTNTDLFYKLLEKHGSHTNTLNDGFIQMMDTLGKLSSDLLSGLRESDYKEYPIYNQINEIVNLIKNDDNMENKITAAIFLLQSVSNLEKRPILLGMSTALCTFCSRHHDCQYCPPKVLDPNTIKSHMIDFVAKNKENK